MTEPLRVGLVGANATGSGWGAATHVPAIRSADGVELAAVCTSRPETAAAAAEAYEVPGYHDVRELAAQPGIDLISVVVRVPLHQELVMPALEAGKHVFCEWPLGANKDQAEEMSALARSKGVVTGIGLQGRQDPTLAYIKELHDDGWLGDVLTANLTMFGGGAGTSHSGTAWMGEAKNGANLLTIVAGHSLDTLAYCVGPMTELTASVATQVPTWQLSDTGDTIDVDAPDDVALTGTLAGGGRVSFHVASVPFHGTSWRLAVYGTRGTLVATTPGLPQITPITLVGSQGDEPLVALSVPERLSPLTADRARGPVRNVASAYTHMSEAIRRGEQFSPDFGHAVHLHELLDAVLESSRDGRAVQLG